MACFPKTDFWCEFMAIFRCMPINIKEKKNEYKRLLEYLIEIQPNANKDDLKNVIHDMWSLYWREFKKKELNESYVPKLWYFDNFSSMTLRGAKYYSDDIEEKDIVYKFPETDCWDEFIFHYEMYCVNNYIEDAYDRLLIKYKEIEPLAEMGDLKKLVHNMWSSYRWELKRKMLDDVFKPRVWYFDDLDNLRKNGAEFDSENSENESLKTITRKKRHRKQPNNKDGNGAKLLQLIQD